MMGENKKFDVFEAVRNIGSKKLGMLSPWEQDELLKHVGIEFIHDHKDILDVFYIFKNKKLSREDVAFFLSRATKSEDFMMAALSQELSEEIMEQHAQRFPWTVLCITQKMSDEFVIRNIEAVDQAYLPYHQDLSSETVKKLTEVNWMALSARYPLTEKFILEYAHKLDRYELRKNTKIEMTDKVRLLLELA
jgi:hypothetical protein